MYPLFKHTFVKSLFLTFCFLYTSFSYAEKPSEQNTIEGIRFDFEDVDIKDLVRFIAETTSMNFIVDKNIKGKVTVISPNKLNKTEALEVFETLLISNGFIITNTKTNNVYRIVRQGESIKTPVDILKKKDRKRRPSELVTKTKKLSYAAVEDIIPIIKPLLSGQSNLTSYQPNNMIILTETYANLQRIEKIINRIDQPIGNRGNISLIELMHADAIQVADIIDRIFSARRLPKGAQRVEIIPEASNNKLIIVADRAQLNEIIRLVENLDSNASNEVRSVEIVYLRHANAKDLEEVIEKIVENTEEEEEDSTNKEKLSVLSNATFRSNISVVADESINALVLSAEPADMVTLKGVIDSLDIRRLQVYIEALVMEVSEDISDQFGVEWRSADDFTSDSGISAFGGQNLSGNLNALTTNPLALPSGMTFGIAGPKIKYQGKEYANIGFLVNALKSNSNINVLATPQLMTLDNEEAKIVVGDTVPFITGTYTNSEEGASNPFQTIERQDVGLTLEIKPQISENGFVRLNIYQEISSVAPKSNASDLITRKRSLKTAVVVPNQSMLALGGLIREDVSETHNRVPCLSSLWGVGEFFKSSSVQNVKTNLMVFIRPVIINTYGDADTITHRKYLKMRTLQLGRERKGSKLIPAHTLPESEAVPLDMRYSRQQYEADKKEGSLSKKLSPEMHLKRTKPLLTTFNPSKNNAKNSAKEGQ